jgi:SPP1 family predicted phage head-tail adaptor
MLPDDELAEMRAEAALALPDTCTIQTATETNTKGSVAVTYADTYTNVPCRLASANSKETERVIGEKLASTVAYVLTVPWNQAITAQDRVVAGRVTYEVIAISSPNATWRTAHQAWLARVD